MIAEPETRGWIRPTANAAVAEFLLPDMTICGYVDFAFPAAGPSWARAVVTSEKEVRVHYMGPWKKKA